MLYYIRVGIKNENTAGPKAPGDSYEVIKGLDGKEILFRQPPSEKYAIYRKLWILVVTFIQWMRILAFVKPDDIIIYQHPTYGMKINNKFISFLKKKKMVKFIALIHDIEILRASNTESKYATLKVTEEELLSQFDRVICHNEQMKQYLIEGGIDKNKLISLEIFDYLTDAPMETQVEDAITIAGNLSSGKSAYIYKLLKTNPDFNLNLFGPNFEIEGLPENVAYFGSLPPDELPGKLKGRFGLVWDGDSLETCNGITGNYLRYNNPHKTSLYLASGLPVIIWKEAALAKFIEEHNVGITVSSLLEINDVLKTITDQEYETMKQNAVEIGLKLREGYYYKKSLEKAISDLSK